MNNSNNHKVLNFGLIGCGRIGALGDQRLKELPNSQLWIPYAHASAIKKAGGQLQALCDSDFQAAKWAGNEFSVSKIYGDYRQMLNIETLDAVAIATRTNVRPDIIYYALEKGIKGMYCEKPLYTTLEKCDEASEAIRKKGTFFFYGPQRRYMPGFTGVYKHVADGKIGKLREINIRWAAGALLWRHPHSVDLACYLAADAEVGSVSANLEMDLNSVKGNLIDCDPMIKSACIEFKNGIRANILVDVANIVELIGDEGRILIEQDSLKSTLCVRGATGSSSKTTDISVPPHESGTVVTIQSLIAAINHEKNPEYTIANAICNQEILFGWLESGLNHGKSVQFPLQRKGFEVTGRTGEKFV